MGVCSGYGLDMGAKWDSSSRRMYQVLPTKMFPRQIQPLLWYKYQALAMFEIGTLQKTLLLSLGVAMETRCVHIGMELAIDFEAVDAIPEFGPYGIRLL